MMSGSLILILLSDDALFVNREDEAWVVEEVGFVVGDVEVRRAR